MTASNRYVPVSLVCLLIASTSAAMAGPSSMLDPYGYVQAPTAKEVEAKTNKARAKKGLPPIYKNAPQATSTTKVEDISATPTTTYVTGPGGGNSKAIKADGTSEAKVSGGGLLSKFGKISVPGLGKDKEAEPVKAAKAPKAVKEKVAKVKETPVSEAPKTASADADGNVVTRTWKAAAGGLMSGSKKVGSGIASGAKASGGAMAKGASAVGSGFKATGEKIKDGSGGVGSKMASMPNLLPNPFKKKDKSKAAKETKVASSKPATKAVDSVSGGQEELVSDNKTTPLVQDELTKDGEGLPTSTPVSTLDPAGMHTNTLPTESTETAVTPATANKTLTASDELVPESKGKGKNKAGKKGTIAGMQDKMTGTFGKLNPFAKKGIAGKKANDTL
jgi:hypothetical protein